MEISYTLIIFYALKIKSLSNSGNQTLQNKKKHWSQTYISKKSYTKVIVWKLCGYNLYTVSDV